MNSFAAIKADPKQYTVEDIKDIVHQARAAAYAAAQTFFNDVMDGQDGGACGFAWVELMNIRGNTKLGKRLKEAGVEQNWNRVFQIWNPSGYPVQNIDTLEAGARAAAEVFKRYGFTAYAGSRLD